MHDTVWFEIQGTPAVSLASTEFKSAAQTQANALGMKDARCVFVDHPVQGTTDEEMRNKAESCIDEVIQALTS
ncbi:MAG: hypothetical protein F4X44_11530 [Gammaproteobacteria bacterium]|nr:hypothetical protein [Gammaproteobacteria bacterium]MYD81230.1 hypothetical protein [Gammaproteobacteria bacterium]